MKDAATCAMPWACGLVLLLGLPLLAHATHPQCAVWEGCEDLSSGKCRSTSLTEDGVLSAAPLTRKLADLGVEEAWSLVAEPSGTLLVGTAPEGKVLRVSPDGTVKLLARFPESHVYALAAGTHGDIFAATSPHGKVYQVSATGKSQIYFDPGETYIWSLAVAPDGALFVGTGTRGKIFRVTGKGNGELWYASNETHIRALAFDHGGALLAGTASSGYLFRVPAKNQAVVLEGTGHEEVNQMQVLPDGTVYFTATGASKAVVTVPDAIKKGTGADDASMHENSALYRLSPTLDPDLVWTTKETILSAWWTGESLLLGMGANGDVYSVRPHGEATRLGRIESESVTAMVRAGKETILASSNPGRLFALGSGATQPGIYETNVFDAGGFARWGAVTADASDPSAVKIFTRSGNTPQADKTWYDWAATSGGHAQSPAARYLQVRLEIGGGTVNKISAYYLARNRPPHLDEVKILPVGQGYQPSPAAALPPLPQSAAQLLAGPGESDAKAPLRYVATSAHGLRTLLWRASDPNGDDLTFTVSWRKEGESTWHDLAREVTENLLTWDTSSWSNGRYELKVEASDAGSNAPGEGLSDAIISREMVVNNSPPVIEVVARRNDTVEFAVRDELDTLRSVTGSNDGKSYRPLVPLDGILDSGLERFSVKLPPGQTLFIRAEDDSGNVAGAQAK